ncbi:hypothetical protein WA026_010122 [Henosepilachna vigintioctopunctata]|uniref:Fe2OG dioxygenase domain-containing protein n=1 Tax=Henosepilachna vigintioctopunctata TaxID=420089 RepID=A0AAW1UKH5_9CUCU
MNYINNYKVEGIPESVFYIPDFITSKEEEEILYNVYSAPKPKWTCLLNRRLQDYGGVPSEKGMIPDKIPQWLQKYMDRITGLYVFGEKKPNHVLVNEYLPGQGIMPHTDGPLFYPTITTISCGSHTLLRFLENDSERKKICDILVERCSLLVIQGDMYSKYLHSIEGTSCDILSKDCVNIRNTSNKYDIGQSLKRDTRISITIRNVPKVLKIGLWHNSNKASKK